MISQPFHHFRLIFEHEDLRIIELRCSDQFERGGGGSRGRAFPAEGGGSPESGPFRELEPVAEGLMPAGHGRILSREMVPSDFT